MPPLTWPNGISAPTPTRSALRDIDLCERRPQPFGKLARVVVGPEVHEIEMGLVIEHVVMDRRDLDPVVAQRFQYRIDFLRDQYEIAGDRCLATPGRLEIDCIG